MSSTKANLNEIEKQEQKDYAITRDILSILFGAKRQYTFHKQPNGSVYDMKMTLCLPKKTIRYHIEIKERTQDIYKYKTLPLSVQKYCNIKDTLTNYNETAKAIYISLLNGYQYYIFDLEKLDLNNCEIRNWSINDVEFSDNPAKKLVPTIFIPLEQCVCHGTYVKSDNYYIITSNANNKQTKTENKSTETTKTTTI